MILPILAYGSPVLKKKAVEISPDYPNLNELIENMWETMYASKGVGLAAPQVGLSIRLFVIDASQLIDFENMDEREIEYLKSFKKVFINPKIEIEKGLLLEFNEGCLSIPDIREEISRKEWIKLSYFDHNFKKKKLELNGLAARVVQHEYDHIDGILFTDHLSPLKKRLLKNRLSSIMKGLVSTNYPMKFPLK